jgi:hypothetical protein
MMPSMDGFWDGWMDGKFHEKRPRRPLLYVISPDNLPLEQDLHCQYDQVLERTKTRIWKKITSKITFTFHLHPSCM